MPIQTPEQVAEASHGPTLDLSVALSPEDTAALVKFTDEVRAKARVEALGARVGVSVLERAAQAYGFVTMPDRVTLFPQQVEMIERIAQALAEVRAQEREARWQPIETAPHDAVVLIFLACPGIEVVDDIVIARWQDDEDFPDGGAWYPACADGGWPIDVPATHWMPLPEPPAAIRARGSHA